jgi:hypothetical protein
VDQEVNVPEQEVVQAEPRKSIPVIGTAVVNNPYWVSRLLMSVDYPVDEFVIINNNGRGIIDADLDALKSIKHEYVKKVTVTHMPANIGCGGAWNLIIKCYMNAPYWLITNDDVAFGPGLLKEMHDLMEEYPQLGMIHPNEGDFNIGAWDLFMIRDIIVQEFGLFDENTYPAYNEDADYIMRMIHRPIVKMVGTENDYWHGFAKASDYYNENAGSQTKKSDPALTGKLDAINQINIEYMTQKWGPDWRVCQPVQHPYGKADIPIDYSTWDLNFVRSKHLGF